MYLQSYL